MSWPLVPASEIMVKRGGSLNPAKFPEETFELLSIPAFDKDKPEILKGAEIGSSKNCIEPGDVLLSKIVPHIRRCWVVPEKGDYRQIGSGEWIIFRDERFDPGFLKHYFTSELFHRQFMNTVAGVGGSLVRARPAGVERIEIPLPPLEEQKRIATILDKADAIRRKRQQAIQLTDEFLRAVFLDMFGDPVTNPKGWEISHLGNLVKVVSGATPSKSNDSFWDGNFPWVSPKDMKVWELHDSIDKVSEIAFEKTNLKKLPERSVLIVVRGMILAHTVPVGINSVPVAINQDVKAFITNEKILPEFLVWFLKSQQENILAKVSSSAHGTKRLELSDLLGLSVMVPDKKLQIKFLKIIRGFRRACGFWEIGEETTFKLFQSLGKEAFGGKI